jgi:aryl-alcohol dehydrogenase-like predicted oxidoreductase
MEVFHKYSGLDHRTADPTYSKRPLGKTGYQVAICGLGGLFTTSMHDRHDEVVEIVNRAIDLRVNYIDASAL